MNCRLLRRHIDAFVDGELDPTTQIDFERHLLACAGCQEHLRFERAVRAEVKKNAALISAPEDLRARIRDSIANTPQSMLAARSASVSMDDGPLVRFVSVRPGYGLPLAAAAVALFVFGGFFGPGSGTSGDGISQASALPIFEDIVQRHASDHPAEVHNVSEEQVSSWFRGKVAFPVRPVRFRAPGARLVGARISNIRERQAAALYYDVGGRRVTVIVFEPRGAVNVGAERANLRGREVHYQRVHGYTVAMMQRDGVTYAATGDLDQPALLDLAASADER